MSIAGCIIPTPLEQQPANVNHPPKIIASQVDPMFPSFTRKSMDAFKFTIVANDDDISDDLMARLLYSRSPGDATRIRFPGDFALNPAASDAQPGRRSGESPSGEWCQTFAPNNGNVAVVWVAVSDHGFTGNDDQTPDDANDLDEMSWVMTCTD